MKFVNTERTMDVLQPIKRDLEFHHENEELSEVSVEIAGVGIWRVRVATLSPEVTEEQIRKTVSKYGDGKGLLTKYSSKYIDFVSKLEYDL